MSITFWQYYKNLSERITRDAFKDVGNLEDWRRGRDKLKQQFMRSMGLDPLPPKCDLKLTEYGGFEGPGYKARKLAYQLLPDVWGTAIAYLPHPPTEDKAPAALFCCGHSDIGQQGYQDHALMWARRGYVCFVFDTIEQHDNPGEHHGLAYGQRYDWISMGYSGAGGELWNTIRALDALVSLPEVDPERIGSTGNSGGGAQSFYVAVADERIKAVASSCGVTTHNHTIARRNLMGHCDCIYNHNPYQKDTSEFAALIAPRAALYCYGIQDGHFSVAEYTSMVERAGGVYELYGAPEKLKLFDYPGPHGYQPESVQVINEWFDLHVAGRPHPEKAREGKTLSEITTAVFNGTPPQPNRLALLPELLSRSGSIAMPDSPAEWPAIVERSVRALEEEVLHSTLANLPSFTPQLVGEWQAGPDPNSKRMEYQAEIDGMEAWISIFNRSDRRDTILVSVTDAERVAFGTRVNMESFLDGYGQVVIEPRHSGFTYCPTQEKFLLRAGALTGITPVMAMIQDLEVTMRFVRGHPLVRGKKIVMYGRADSAVACLYHTIMHDDIAGLVLENLPASHLRGGYILGVLRVMDIVHALGLVAPRPLAVVNMERIRNKNSALRPYQRLGHPDNILIERDNLDKALRHVMTK